MQTSLFIHFCFVYVTSLPLSSQQIFLLLLVAPSFLQASLLPFAFAHQELWLLCIGAHRGHSSTPNATSPQVLPCL
jgi:hypothetical protein